MNGVSGARVEGDDVQALVQGRQRRRVARPEAATRASDVPVGQVVDVRREQRPGALGVEALHRRGHLHHHPVRSRERPAVQGRPVGDLGGRVAGSPVGRAGVEHLEGDRVPVGQQDLADGLLDGVVPDPPRGPRRSAGSHEPADGVGSVLVHQRDRLEDVAEVLGHLAAVLGQDVAQAEHVLVRRLVEDQRPDGHQRVEPAAGLVDRLADEVGRVGLLEHRRGALDVRVAPLRERHRPGVEPRVDHLGHAGRRVCPAGGAGEGHARPRRDGAGPARTGRCRSARRARHGSRHRSGGPRRRPRSGAAYPSSACGRAPSRCCSRASRRSDRA